MQIPVRIIQSIRAPSPFMKSMPEVIMSAISDPKIPVLIRSGVKDNFNGLLYAITSDVGLGALGNVDVGHDGVGSSGQADDESLG